MSIRQYYPIWAKLKQSYKVSITAPRALHARIIKAVTKEKWMDIGFKLKMEGKLCELHHVREASIIHFRLEIKSHTLDRRMKQISDRDF